MPDADWLQELKRTDPRVGRVERMVDIETELRDSAVVRVLCEFAESEARDARDALGTVLPTNVAEICRLQQVIRLPEIIQDVIEAALLSGKAAVDELNEETGA